MDARTWLGLEPSHNPHRWHLPVSKGISTGHRAMLVEGLGAAIAAMEGTSDRPVVWATAQYLLFAKVGTVVDLMSLLQFMVKRQQKLSCRTCRGTEIITVNAALGLAHT
ncbi:MAG: hypothetical protein Ct9H90mP11_07910 [Acidimicrobiales bacterium]|nr:MAG: hypothetical protein Ct9H90mP11_07910 [Acidimicrobiales bacterium]